MKPSRILSLALLVMALAVSSLTPSALAQQKKVFTVNGVSFTMVHVQGGTFLMGATPEQKKPLHDEKPTRHVTLSDYSIGATEVTQALWVAVMGKNPSNNVGPDLPVERVSWNDCQVFLQKLNQLTGQKFRLPTEAEWEYAARGGKYSKHTQYAGSDSLRQVAWYYNNSGFKFLTDAWLFQDQVDNKCGTHPVGQLKPNELGLYDMSGNVWEWCQDWYATYQPRSDKNPSGPASGNARVTRGGSWAHSDVYCRITRRNSSKPAENLSHNGLRLAL